MNKRSRTRRTSPLPAIALTAVAAGSVALALAGIVGGSPSPSAPDRPAKALVASGGIAATIDAPRAPSQTPSLDIPQPAAFDVTVERLVGEDLVWGELDPDDQAKIDKMLAKIAKHELKLLNFEAKVAEAEEKSAGQLAKLLNVQALLPGLETAMFAAQQTMLDLLEALLAAKEVLQGCKADVSTEKGGLKQANKLPSGTADEIAAKAAALAAAYEAVVAALAEKVAAKEALIAARKEYKEGVQAFKLAKVAWKAALKLEALRLKKIAALGKKVEALEVKHNTISLAIIDLEESIQEILDSDDGEGDPGENGGSGGSGGGGDPPPPDPDDPAPGGVPEPNPQSGPVDVPVIIQEAIPSGASGIDRAGAGVTFGVPFPEGVVYEVQGRPSLAMDGASRFQFSTLSSWPDGSVRWALASTIANLDAGKKNASQSVVEGGGVSGQNSIATQQSSRIVLNTGVMQVDLLTSGTFNLFDRVVINGKQVVDPGTSPGIRGLTTDGFLMGPSPVTSFTIEQNGPMRAVVRADGKLRAVTGDDILDFSCWITTHYGSTDVEVTFTVRNANISRPKHAVIDSLGLVVQLDTGSGAPTARFAQHNGIAEFALQGNNAAYLYQAYSSKDTLGVEGKGPGYKPHIAKDEDGVPIEKGYRLVHNGNELHSLGNEDQYPDPCFADLRGTNGGATVAIRNMAQWWPAALEVSGDGSLAAGLWTGRKQGDYTFVWRQHESRSCVFSFHDDAGAPETVAARCDVPLAGRVADYSYYNDTGVFPYHLVTIADQEAVYSDMGMPKAVYAANSPLEVTRFLPAHGTGGTNNHAGIEKDLAGMWMRHGRGGPYLNGMDLALYKSEWQIQRSDGWHDQNDPGASNDEIAHTTAHEGDTEHRYREGIILAYHLTGDMRFYEAIFDEVEILSDIYLGAQERGMLQTIRAQAIVAEFTDSAVMKNKLRERIVYNNSNTLDVDTGVDGWGWQTESPDLGSRRYFVNSGTAKTELGPGENYITRGFVAASFGPIAMFHAARVLGLDDADGLQARGRLRDYAYYTRKELLPWQPNPATRSLVYSYGVKTKTVNSYQNSNSHPILLGLGEAWLDTGDDAYLDKAIEYVEQCYAQDHGEGSTDLDGIENRLDFQHFIRIYQYATESGQYP